MKQFRHSLQSFLNNKGINFLICFLVSSMILSLALSSVALVSIYVLSVWLIIFNYNTVNFKPIDILFFLFFGIQAISFLWTENTKEYFNEIEKNLLFIFIPLLFIYSRSNKVKLNLNSILFSYLFSLITFGIILLFSSIYDIILNHKPIVEFISKNVRFNLIELSPISFHTPFLGMFLVFGIVVSYYLYSKDLIKKVYFIFLLMFFLLLLHLNSNLSSFISLFILTILFIAFKLKTKTLIISVAIILSFAILLISMFFNDLKSALYFDPADGYWETPRYRILRFLHEGDPTRNETWRLTIDIIRDNFWLGTGVGDLVDNLQSLRDPNTFAFSNKLNTHNQYLSIFGTTGIIGLLIFLALLINNIVIALKNKAFFFIAFIIITLIAFSTENILSRQWGLIFFVLFNYIINEHINHFKGKIKL